MSMMIPINALRCLGIDKSIFVLRSLMLISVRNANLGLDMNMNAISLFIMNFENYFSLDN